MSVDILDVLLLKLKERTRVLVKDLSSLCVATTASTVYYVSTQGFDFLLWYVFGMALARHSLHIVPFVHYIDIIANKGNIL